ncbi:phage portal protein [Microbacterium sp. ISL-103]|uniref:phage portal protein n=1 Tax=Microbacterium sp. ISL-103 TaxID=2819156 RepID=UPI001BE666E4|nr:phage portal protein [Microbacterium sp. ISL-103]MBT2473302.1 phage portal protein [Microbacterium sp. ISL-103]
MSLILLDGETPPMDAAALGALGAELKKDAQNTWAPLRTLQKHIDGQLLRTWMPDNADAEYKDLLRKSASPWLGFARDAIAQGCIVSGYTNTDLWNRVWRANGMDGRQEVVTRDAVGFSRGFVAVLPGADPDSVVMRPMSALDTYAVFDDPWDDYPRYVLHRRKPRAAGKSFWQGEWMLVDEEGIYRFKGTPDTPVEMTFEAHGMGSAPIVAVSNSLDAAPISSIADKVSVYKRIVDATFTLQMLQRYGAFPQKWMAGGEVDPNVRSSVAGLLHAGGEAGDTARFGAFPASDLEKAVSALDAHIKHFSAVVQVPPHYLLGAVVNMSAEGIAAAEAGYHRNLSARKKSIGEGYELAMRTAASMLGDEAAAASTTDQVEWENVSSWSLSQVSDFVQKVEMSTGPLEELFRMIPGWTKADAAKAHTAALAKARALAEQITPAPQATPA